MHDDLGKHNKKVIERTRWERGRTWPSWLPVDYHNFIVDTAKEELAYINTVSMSGLHYKLHGGPAA